MSTVRVFNYIDELDAFLVTEEYESLADRLGLTEWTPVVWICRLFTLDNDYGEHWFDNWDEREALEERAKALGIETFDLMILNPKILANGYDGPCHSPEIRKAFWTDVLKSLELSYALLFQEARAVKADIEAAEKNETIPEQYVPDLEEKITQIQSEIATKRQ